MRVERSENYQVQIVMGVCNMGCNGLTLGVSWSN